MTSSFRFPFVVKYVNEKAWIICKATTVRIKSHGLQCNGRTTVPRLQLLCPVITYLKSRSPIHASKLNSPRISSTIISRSLLRHFVLAVKIFTLILPLKYIHFSSFTTILNHKILTFAHATGAARLRKRTNTRVDFCREFTQLPAVN